MPKETHKSLDRQLRTIRIKHDLTKTTIGFADVVDAEPIEGQEESSVIGTTYKAESAHRPHVDFTNALKRLLTHALAIAEIKVEDKNPSMDYTITGLNIDGDLGMNKARVAMIISKLVRRTGKVMVFPPTPQVTLSDESDYEDWKSLKKLVEKVQEEAWEFLKGKHEGDTIQLAFSFNERDEVVVEEVREKKSKKKKQPKAEVEAVNDPEDEDQEGEDDGDLMGEPAMAIAQ